MKPTDHQQSSRQRVIAAAKELFAARGYDGTTVKDIAARAGVNKALIYYYFDSKGDILASLFAELGDGVRGLLERIFAAQDREALAAMDYNVVARQMFDLVFDFLVNQRQVVKVLIAESLKGGGEQHLFGIADLLILPEVDRIVGFFEQAGVAVEHDRQLTLVTEFFTGFMPMVTCVIYYDQWLARYGMTEAQLKEKFFEAFRATHLANQMRFLEQVK